MKSLALNRDTGDTLEGWQDVNLLLKQMRENKLALDRIVNDRETAVQRISIDAQNKIDPLERELQLDAKMIERFVRTHESEMDGRSKRLEFGRVGLRKVVRYIYSIAVDKLIASLEKSKLLRQFVKVKKLVDKEALKKDPRAARYFRVQSSDEFFYEFER